MNIAAKDQVFQEPLDQISDFAFNETVAACSTIWLVAACRSMQKFNAC